MNNLTEKQIDKKLNINTRGLRKSKTNKHYRYEATPYLDLLLLFDLIKLTENDHLVDVGSGKGRVCFLVNYLFKSKTTGIEANIITFDDAIYNLNTYESNNKENIKFINDLAENYQITDENYFFFFNPFDISILKKVLSNISKSLIFNKRKITLIFAYPFNEYVEYLLNHTNFVVSDYIESDNIKIKMNKFLILQNE